MKLKCFTFLLAFTVANLDAASIIWTNTAGGSWQTAANWSPNQVPGPADTATITAAGTYTVTIANNTTVSTVILGGGAGFPTLLLSANTFDALTSATISANGTLTITGGGVTGKINIIGGVLRLEGSAQKGLYAATVFNNFNGTIQWLAGNIGLGSTPTTIITNAGLWEISGDNTIFQGIGGPDPEITNSGTIRKIGGSGATSFSNLKFKNTGTVSAQIGTIQFGGMNAAEIGGTFTADAGATIRFAGGTYTENGGAFTGAGLSEMTAGTLTMVTNTLPGLTLAGGNLRVQSTFQNAGAITNLTINGATLIGTNEVAGTLTLTSGSIANLLTVRPAGTLNFTTGTQKGLYELRLINHGTVNWLGGNLALGSTPTSFITNAGLWEINSDTTIFQGIGGADPVFVNHGTLRKIGGSGTSTFSNLQFINSGAVEAQNGTISFTGMNDALLGGTFTAQPGATIQFAGGTYTENGATFGGGGTLRMTAGTLTLVNNPLSGLTLTGGTVRLLSTFQNNGAITNLALNGATLSGTNEVSGVLTVLSGSLRDQLTVRTGATLTFSSATQKGLYELRLINNGTVRWLGGNLALGSTPTTFITNNALWEINSDETVFQGIGGPDPVVVNKGTGIIRKTGGSGTTTFSNLKFVNEGLVEVQNGTISFNGMNAALIGGTFTAATGATLQFAGGTYFESGGVFNGAGTLRMTAGTLTLETNILTGLSLNGGNIRIEEDFQDAGAITNLTLNGATLIGTNEVSGTLTVLSGTLSQSLTIRPTGTLTLSSGTQKGLYSLGLINHGKVQWLGGNLALGDTPTTMITNAGLWEINSDATVFQGIGGATPMVRNFGTIRKLGGSATTRFSNLQFINGGAVDVQNGTIQFDGAENSLMGGTFTASSGASLLLSGGSYIENGGVFTGAGTLRFTSGTLNLVTNLLNGLALAGGNVRLGTAFQSAGAITNLTLNGSTLTGTNEVAGTLTVVSGGISGRLTVRPSGQITFTSTAQKGLYELTLNNNGTVLWQDGNLALGSTPTTMIFNAGLWDARGDNTMFQGIGGADPVFSNAATGTFRKSAGAQVTSFSNFTFNNNGLVEAQTGTIRFPNAYTHNNGRLRLAGGRIEASGTLTVASGTLEGSGSFGTSSFTGGTISPGINGPGKITFTSGLNLSPGATVVIDAINATPETGYDQLAVTGSINLGGANLQVASLASLVVGSQLRIIDNDGVDGIIGLFNSFPEGWLFSHNFQLYRIRYSVGTGNDVAIIRDDGGVRLTAIALQPDGSFLLNGLGTNFGDYTISATTDFKTWSDLGTTKANNGGNFQFFDTNRANLPQRFYRSLGPGVSP